MNQFGGYWTDNKMDIIVAYAKAYLTIMKTQAWAKTLYFDGFAGSGSIADKPEHSKQVPPQTIFGDLIEHESFQKEPRKGTALSILDINYPKPFDMYYFVEKNEEYQRELKEQVEKNYSAKKGNSHVVLGDCNDKMVEMSKFLTKHKNYRALAFIDPYGMSVKWSSIESLKGKGVDLWILVPTGVGANRVLVNDGNIPEAWLKTLESFLGMASDKIKQTFYKQVTINNLFDEEMTLMEKEKDTVNKIGRLYSERLKEIFTYVSDPFVLRNSMNSIMYHFMMATNNKNALKIANDVIKPKYKI